MSNPVTSKGRSGWTAVAWTLVCPGLGEYRLGHRALGATIGLIFLAVCGWLMVGTYSMIQDIAEFVKTSDPSLLTPPENLAEVMSMVGRLATGIHKEYMVRRAAIHQKMWLPIWILCAMYAYSLVQSYVLGVRKDRAAAAVTDAPPNPAA